MASQPRIKMERIVDAAGVIDPVFLKSPQFNCEPLSEALGAQLTLKIESMNPIRCFKGRGADFLVAEAERAGDEREMICASAGNFGQAMAYSARRRGRSVAVYAAENASPLKIERMRALGADVRLFGADFDTAKSEARKVAAETGARMVEDGLDVETAEGAGTIGLELTEDGAPLDAVIVPLGNGALINGIATAVKANSPSTQVIAVQSDGAPAMIESWRTETVVETETVDTIADGIAVRVPVPEALADMRGIVDDGLLVPDAAIIAAMRQLHEVAGLVTEPSGAIGIAAIAENRARFAGQRVATIICGSNVTRGQMREWLIA